MPWDMFFKQNMAEYGQTQDTVRNRALSLRRNNLHIIIHANHTKPTATQRSQQVFATIEYDTVARSARNERDTQGNRYKFEVIASWYDIYKIYK